MYHICFVCTGNICRSPMAAAVCRAQAAERGLGHLVTADSAGTDGWHLGEEADPRAAACLAAAGYDITHTARQFDTQWFDRYQLVVALDRGHARHLRRMAAGPGQATKVRLLRSFDPAAQGWDELDVYDPYYGDDAGFDMCLKLIEAAMPGLLEEVAEQLDRDGGQR